MSLHECMAYQQCALLVGSQGGCPRQVPWFQVFILLWFPFSRHAAARALCFFIKCLPIRQLGNRDASACFSQFGLLHMRAE